MNALFSSELLPERSESLGAPTPPPVRDEGTEAIDLHLLLALLRRNLLLVAVTLAVALGAGLLVTLLTTPRYVAASRIQVEQQADRVLRTDDESPAMAQDADRFLQTATDVLKSRSMAIGVAQSLHLFGDRRFHTAMGSSPASAAGAVERERVIGMLGHGLTVDLPRNSRIMTLSFEARDPRVAAEVANAYAHTFIALNIQRKFAASAYARDFLAGQLVEAKARLERSERELNGYARAAGLLSTRPALGSSGTGDQASPTPQSVTTASLTQLNVAYNSAKAARIAAEQRWRQAAAQSPLALPDVLASPAVQTLLQQRATLTAELREARERYRSGFPALQEKQSQLDEINQQLSAIAGDVRQSILGRYQAAQHEEQALGSEVARLRAASMTEQDNSVRFTVLAREVDTNRALYDALLGRFKELSATAGVTASNVTIVDTAEPPLSPAAPKPLLDMAVALLAGVVIAVVLVIVRERVDDVARGPLDLERKLGLPALGVIPRLAPGLSPVEQLRQPKSMAVESYAALRSALLYSTPQGLPRSVLVTSTQAGEGKSTSSLAMAEGFARLGRRVVLVDGDLRRPSLHKMMAVAPGPGLSDLLVGAATPAEAARPVAEGGFALVVAGPLPPNPTDLLSGGRLPEIIGALEASFDVVVIDGPPVLGLADSPMLGANVQAVLFVVEANRGLHGRTRGAIRRLRLNGATILGALLTKFEAQRAGVDRYYGYDYYTYHEADRAA